MLLDLDKTVNVLGTGVSVPLYSCCLGVECTCILTTFQVSELRLSGLHENTNVPLPTIFQPVHAYSVDSRHTTPHSLHVRNAARSTTNSMLAQIPC